MVDGVIISMEIRVDPVVVMHHIVIQALLGLVVLLMLLQQQIDLMVMEQHMDMLVVRIIMDKFQEEDLAEVEQELKVNQ